MKWIGVVLCVLVAVAWAGDSQDEKDMKDTSVLSLTKDNFDEITEREDLMLVEFYAPWCGHCKHLRPKYAEAAEILKKNDPPILLAKVDATVETDLASRFKVHGYPTLKILRNGKESDYNGPRETEGIVNYMKKQVGPAAKPISTAEELTAFTTLDDKKDVVVVGFLPEKNSQLYSSFLVIANKLRDDFFFAIVTDPELCKNNGAEKESLIVFKSFDDKKATYTGKTKTKDIESWLYANSLPLVGEFKESKAELYRKRGLPIAKYYMKLEAAGLSAKHARFYVTRLEQVAKEFEGKIIVAVVDSTKAEHDIEALGWKEAAAAKSWEGGLVIEKSYKEKFRMDKSFKVPNLKKFFEEFLAGELKQYIKSEPVPATNDGPVTVVVGETFNEIVMDEKKDVLIEFYAPWCGHCKALEPKYKDVGKKFKNSESVVIAKMDATANDYPPQFEVSGFPTIYFKPAGKNSKPMKYEGEREASEIIRFVKKNAKNAIKTSKKRKSD